MKLKLTDGTNIAKIIIDFGEVSQEEKRAFLTKIYAELFAQLDG